ncbi:MAG: ATP-binding protein [Acidobacteriota bacterium]
MSIPINETLYYIFVSLSGFLATSLLVNYISERSRRVREQLREVGDELSELQSFNERVIDNISSGLLVLSPEGTITYVNLPGAAIVGYEPAELKGLPLTAVYAGGDGLLADAPPHLERRKIFRFEDAFLSRAGVLIPVGGSLTSLPDIRGGRAGFVLIFQDLTELKKLEGEVRLREKLSAVGSLAAGIAHEIRNPLASMSGSVQLLRAELALTGDQRRLMDILVDESRRLSRIIQDFLTYARPQKPHLETVRLSELLEQTLILLEHSEERKEAHELLVERGTADDRVLADAGQIKQVFWNLSLNALSAMPRGGRLTIRLDADRPESVRVVFVDQGHGISKQRLETLFTPFNSGSPARLGLGLSIVYGILREHEGTIAVESEEGRGTKITIELPRRLVPESVKAAVR